MHSKVEKEPNNFAPHINDLGSLSPENPIFLSGQLNSENDPQDWFYIYPMLSGNITASYVDDQNGKDVLTKYFGQSEQVPYHVQLEEDDKGIFNYLVKLSLTPDGQPLPSPTEEQLGPQPDPTLLPHFKVPPPQAVLGGVPQYEWYHGCTPTGVASIMGYWDQRGYDNLFKAHGYDEVRQTEKVKDEISSPEHNAKYGDGKWLDAVDKPWLPSSNSSIADYLGTSTDGLLDFNYGTTAPEDIEDGIRKYAAYKKYDFNVDQKDFADFGWDDLKFEIDNGRPMLASIDVPSNGTTGNADHAVPVLGYSEGDEGDFYYFYTNWSEDEGKFMRAKWEQAKPGVDWGVDDVWTIYPQNEPVNDSDLPLPPPPPPPPDNLLIT